MMRKDKGMNELVQPRGQSVEHWGDMTIKGDPCSRGQTSGRKEGVRGLKKIKTVWELHGRCCLRKRRMAQAVQEGRGPG